MMDKARAQTYFRALIPMLALAFGCDDVTEAKVDCNAEQASVIIVAEPGELQSDGSVTIYGSVRFAPLYGSDGGSGGGDTFERTVRAVYVGTVEASPTAGEFNFRTWSVQLQADRLAAHDDGTGNARLPVDAYVYGGCVVGLESDSQPVVVLPDESGGGGMGSSGGGMGNRGGDGGEGGG